ncbi:MAG: lysylphosphatidylglycerol synthase domain-containing protein [Steroidobacteraceae bacterium]
MPRRISASSLTGITLIKRLAKIAVATALLALLVQEADWSRTARYLERLSYSTLAAVFVAMFIGLVLSAWKWSYALKIQALSFRFGRLLRDLCTGFFFNSFLPTAIGGDAYRVYRTLPPDGYATRALAAVALERVIGLLALLVLGCVGALALMHRSTGARVYLVAAGCGALGAVLVLFAIRHGWVDRLAHRWRHLYAVDAFLHSVDLLRRHPDHWPPLIGLSFAFQIVSIGVIFVLYHDINATITIPQCALIAAMVGLSAIMPISINGIGVMEGAFVGTAVALGLDYEQALIVAIERRFIALLLSATCGILYLAEAHQSSAMTGQERLFSTLRSLLRRDSALARTAVQELPRRGAMNDLPVPLETGILSRDRWNHSEILEYIHDAIIIWEMNGRGILYWNRAAEHLYGYSRTAAHGRTTHELLRTEFPGGVRQLESMLTRYGVWAGELSHVTRDGRRINVEGRLALMAQRDGRWLVLEVNRDLADQALARAAQEAMQSHIAILRTQVSR